MHTLIIADGSYTYVADQSAADDLDGDSETDAFVDTVSDGTTTQTANLTITVIRMIYCSRWYRCC